MGKEGYSMKKSYLWTGLGMIVLGMIFLAIAIFWDTPLGSLLCGFSGAFTAPGIVQVIKYVKWSNPKNAPLYRERLEEEQIELRDERKEMLRNKSGRYAYILGLLVAAAAMRMGARPSSPVTWVCVPLMTASAKAFCSAAKAMV